MASPFVKPQTVQLNLDEGQWIEVKKELNVGDQKRLIGAGVKRSVIPATGLIGTEIGWDYEIERALVWIVDWSFRDDQQQKVAVTRSAVESLQIGVFQTIQNAISKHIETTEEKKRPVTTSTE